MKYQTWNKIQQLLLLVVSYYLMCKNALELKIWI